MAYLGRTRQNPTQEAKLMARNRLVAWPIADREAPVRVCDMMFYFPVCGS